MGLADISVRRPVTIVMFFLGILLLGLISLQRLPQELYPPITYPQLSVVTFYKDAAPEEMETLVTKPIEEAIGTVSGVRRISSTSKEETSLVVAEFNWGINMDFAALGAREKIDLIKESLPRGCEDPIVMKYNPFELPLLVLNITADKTSAGELQKVVKKVIKNELEKADGVAACNITGALTPEVIIEIDQDKLMSKGVALNEVVESVSKANLNYPAGTIEESFYEYLIRTMGEFKIIKEIDDVVVGIDDRTKRPRPNEFEIEGSQEPQAQIPDKRLILLKDIATIKYTFKEKTSISRFKNKDNISLSIQKSADANTLKVANNIKDVLKRIKKLIPPDIDIDIVYDQSGFIKSAVTGVTDAAWQGGFLAFLVLLFFLRNVRSATIVTITIPLSIFATFSLMYFSNITVNMISLGGLALGVGMLVDAGIVVVENIYRYREEEKKPPKEASIYGTNEVSGAVMGSVLTTVVVFLPMIFVIGIAGQLFKELAFTVTFSLLASWVVSMTLIPMLSSTEHSIPKVIEEGSSKSIVDKFLNIMYKTNETLLAYSLNHRMLSVLIVLSLFIASCLIIPKLDIEFLPKVDQGQFIIKLNLPPGTKLEVTDSVAQLIESYLADIQEVDSVTVNIGSTKEKKGTAMLETMGPHEGQIIVNLKPLASWFRKGEGYRTLSTESVLERLKDSLQRASIKNAKIEYILQESVFKSAFQAGASLVIEVKGPDLNKLRHITDDIEKELKVIPGVYSIRDSLIEPAPEVKINVFKEKATAYGLSVTDIALNAQTAVKGYEATKFKEEGEEIDIRVRLRKQDRDNMTKVRRLNLRSQLGIDVPLAEVAYFTIGKGPTEIKRQDQQRIVVVTGGILNRPFKEISDIVVSLLKKLKLTSGYSAELKGEQEQIQESFDSLRLALILSVVLVFMIMASQFESIWQPFLIMFTIPLSIIGVAFALFLTKTPLSVMVVLGFIILGGIVVDNAIVLVDYVNILRREHKMSAEEAVVVASRRRLRPILMTSLTTILGLVPMALAYDEGTKLQQPMAITVMGGLTVTTFLSLVFIPTLYLISEDILIFLKERIFGFKKREAIEVSAEGAVAVTIEGPEIPKPTILKEEGLAIKERAKIEYEEDIMQERKLLEKKEAEGVKPAEEKAIVPPEEQRPILLPEPPQEIKPPEEKKPEPKKEIPEVKPPEEKAPRPPQAPKIKDIPERGKIPIDLWDSLVSRQQELIKYIRQNRKITRKEYADKFNISVPTAARDLKFLTDKGILTAKGPAAVGRYYVLKENV